MFSIIVLLISLIIVAISGYIIILVTNHILEHIDFKKDNRKTLNEDDK